MSTHDYLDTLGAELDAAWQRRYGTPNRTARRRRVHAVRLAAVLVALATIAAVVLARASGPGALDAARAAAGTYPSGSIVHFTSVTRDATGSVTQATELWGTLSAPFSRRSIIGTGASAIEQGASGDELTQYDPSGIVYVRTLPGGTADGTRAADFHPGATDVRALLRDGDARDEGTVAVGQTKVHRFVLSARGGGTCTYDVEPGTYFALALSCTGTPDGATVERWNYVPRRGNEHLVSVAAQHPQARVDRAPATPCADGRHTASTPPCVVTSPGA